MLALREWLYPSKWEIIGNVESWGRRMIYQVWRQLVTVHGKKKDRCFWSIGGGWKMKEMEKERGEAVSSRVMTWSNHTVTTCTLPGGSFVRVFSLSLSHNGLAYF